MGKFTAIQTYDRFLRLWEQNEVNDRSLNFILDTGQLYTHGIFLNSVAYGTEANGAVLLTIAGTQKTLSLSNHTHSTYLEKNADIDLGSYKIVSGQKDLLYYSGGNTYLGNTTSPAVILGTSLSTVRSDTTYTVLDTGNFSIGNTTTAGYTLLNVAVFKYGSNSFQLDYVKRVNTSSTFDALAAYTSAGTTQVNNKLYGVITLYTDGTILSPSWAQFRVDIADQLVLFRTSKDSTEWINLNQIEVPLNALNVAGSVAAPTSADANKVWKTDGSGNPAWRADSGNTWRNIRINDEESDSLGTGTGTGALYIKQGTGITVSWSGNKIVIANSAPDTWKAANSLQEGYVPKLDGSGTISTQASEYVLTYTSGSGTITPTWKLLPANAFNDTTYSVTDTTGISLSGTTLSLNVGTRDATNASSAATYVLNRFYQIVTDKNKKLGVVVPWSEGSNTTAIKQAVVTGTKKDDDTLITSDSGLIIQGGTNLIKIGDGTNYIEVPITPSITNNVTGTGTNGKLAKWSGDHTLTDGPGFSNAITTQSLSTKFLREDGTWAAPSYTSSLTFYNLIFKKSDDTTLMTYLPTTSPSKTLKLGSGIGFDLSGDVLTISASDTKYYLTLNGTANGNSGTTNLGTIYAPTSSGTGFLKCTVNNGTITWSYDNSTYNNYELPTATNEVLGGVKVGTTLESDTGYTKVHIKDNFIYYKDTNTWNAVNNSQAGYVPQLSTGGGTIATQSTEYVLTFISGGTGTITPTWKLLPSNAFNNTWTAMTGASSTSNGTIGYINSTPPSDGYNTKYWRADGTWSVPDYPTYSDKYITLVDVTDDNTNHPNLLRYVLNEVSNYFTVPYSTTSNTSNSSYFLKGRTNTITDSGIMYISGLIKTGTSSGNTYSGSSTDASLLCFPPGKTAINSEGTDNESANISLMRIVWGALHWHDLHFSPNYVGIYHRASFGSTAYDWRLIVETLGDKGNSTKPVYISDGLVYECDSYYTAVPVLGSTDTTTNATSDTSNPYLNIIENSAKSGGILFLGSGGTTVKAKNGILTISSTSVNNNTFSIKSKIGDAAAVTLSDFTANLNSDDDFTLILGTNITFTNDTTNRTLQIDAANTDKTGVKKGTAGATEIINGTVIQAESSTGIIFEGGTNQFKVGNGTNSITINVAHGLTTFVKSGTNAASGLVPKPDTTAGTTKFLREDGTWQVPSYTSLPTFYDLTFNNGTSDVLTYDPDGSTSKTIKKGDYISFTVSDNILTISSLDTWIAWAGATSSNGGTAGYMPAPGTANYQKFLRGDGTWCSLSTPDDTTTLTRASGNLTKDTWSDVGTFADTVSEGTWVISFTIDGSLYSGVFSRKKNDTMNEEIDLHTAGTSIRRIYVRTTGNKIQIATSDDTFNPGAVTFNFRKLI